jgi:hypothetical protein
LGFLPKDTYEAEKFHNFDEVQFINLFFLCFVFLMLQLRDFYLVQGHQGFLQCFPLKVFVVLAFTFTSLTTSSDICVWCKVKVPASLKRLSFLY